MALLYTQHTLDPNFLGLKGGTHVATADAELRIEGSKPLALHPPARELPYTARALACHFTTDRASVSTSFLLLLRAFEAQTQLALYALYTKVN